MTVRRLLAVATGVHAAEPDPAYPTGTFTIDGGLTAASPLNPGLF